MLNEWLDYLDAQVGKCVYVWGAQGQRAAEVGDVRAWIFRRSQGEAQAKRAWAFYQTLAAKIGEASIRFFDCSGLAMYFFEDLKGVSGDTTAHGLWKGCAELQKGELRPGDMAFMDTGGRKTHIGYVGRDGQIVEARASGYGVERNPVDARPWTHFGRHKWLREEIEAGEADAVEPEALARSVKQWQSLLMIYDPTCLPRYGADGKYGDETDRAVCRLMDALAALRKFYGRE